MKIIDNKKIDLTDSEWQLYQSICRSYDKSNFKGETLFKDLFETDENGIILLLKPPSERYTSFEVFLYLVSVFQQQHARVMYKKLEELMKQVKDKLAEVK